MDGVVADPGVVMAKASVHTPAAPKRDAAELLDVNVDQVALVFVFVAPDPAPSGAIHPTQPVQVPAHQGQCVT